MDIGRLAAAAPASLPQATQAMQQAQAHSVVAKVPELARAMSSTEQTISNQLAAYSRDKDPEHLLVVIRLQRSIINSQTHHLCGAVAEVGAAHQALSATLDHVAAAQAGAPKAAAASSHGLPLARASAAADEPVRRMLDKVAAAVHSLPAAPALQAAGIPHTKGTGGDVHSLMLEMQKTQHLMQTLSNLQKSMHDASMSVIRNMR